LQAKGFNGTMLHQRPQSLAKRINKQENTTKCPTLAFGVLLKPVREFDFADVTSSLQLVP
jgi:hypothetical protein